MYTLILHLKTIFICESSMNECYCSTIVTFNSYIKLYIHSFRDKLLTRLCLHLVIYQI